MNLTRLSLENSALRDEINRFPDERQVRVRAYLCLTCSSFIEKEPGDRRCSACQDCKGNAKPIKFTSPLSIFNCPLKKWKE